MKEIFVCANCGYERSCIEPHALRQPLGLAVLLVIFTHRLTKTVRVMSARACLAQAVSAD
jgi:hypothetical protein